jgi:hypothetical protein
MGEPYARWDAAKRASAPRGCRFSAFLYARGLRDLRQPEPTSGGPGTPTQGIISTPIDENPSPSLRHSASPGSLAGAQAPGFPEHLVCRKQLLTFRR